MVVVIEDAQHSNPFLPGAICIINCWLVADSDDPTISLTGAGGSSQLAHIQEQDMCAATHENQSRHF